MATNPSMPTLNALFGTDRDGNHKWFCSLKRTGCSGILATLTNEKPPELLDLENERKYLLGHPGWERLNDGSYGVNTRPAFRSVRSREARMLIKLAEAETEGLNPETQEYMLMESNTQKEENRRRNDPTESVKKAPCWIPISHLPVAIVCPACKKKSWVPSYRGAHIDVRNGSC